MNRSFQVLFLIFMLLILVEFVVWYGRQRLAAVKQKKQDHPVNESDAHDFKIKRS